jgi:hypothetical protein
VGNFLSRGRDDWPAVDKDKAGDSGRDWARELAPRSLLLVSIFKSTDGCGYITEWVPVPLVWQSTETQVHMAIKVNLRPCASNSPLSKSVNRLHSRLPQDDFHATKYT